MYGKPQKNSTTQNSSCNAIELHDSVKVGGFEDRSTILGKKVCYIRALLLLETAIEKPKSLLFYTIVFGRLFDQLAIDFIC